MSTVCVPFVVDSLSDQFWPSKKAVVQILFAIFALSAFANNRRTIKRIEILSEYFSREKSTDENNVCA